MRNKILELLLKGKDLHNELITKFSDVLPENIIEGGNDNVNSDMPKKINVILSLLNMSEKKEVFPPINNLDEAIEVFKNGNLDEAIERAISNTDLLGFSELKNETLSVKDILENAEFGINSGVQLLQMQIQAGELTKNNN